MLFEISEELHAFHSLDFSALEKAPRVILPPTAPLPLPMLIRVFV